jgi:predicted dehydrogenase
MTGAIRPARVGMIGCGDVTRLYLPGMARFPVIELAACADLDAERAAAVSASAGIPAVPVEALLADPTIEVVLVLTPPTTHAAVARAAIAAGKHVYTEKPLATTLADAASVLTEADAAGVRVGAAPDTFLGGGLRTARALVDEGAIGTPRLALATFAGLGPERWHPSPASFYAPGGGPLLDVGPYSVTALVDLLGPVRRVAAAGVGVGSERRIGSGPNAGGSIVSAVPTSVLGTLEFASGVVAALAVSFDVVGTEAPYIEVHGTTGSLTLGDPNWFDGFVRHRSVGDEATRDVPLRFDASIGRGVGLADMIEAMRTGRPHRASGALAEHVLEVLLALEAATRVDRWIAITSTVERPGALVGSD